MQKFSNKKELKITGIYGFERHTSQELPLFTAKISAGFPSPADDFIEKKLDLNEFLIKHPSSTFFVKVEGESMINAGIHNGDILIVDRAEELHDNKIIIAMLGGEFTVKRIKKSGKKLFLVPENPDFKAVEVTPDMEFEVWGIVNYVIHKPV